MKKIYIAGFDVFLDNAIEIGKNYKEICAKYGFEGLFPTDNELDGDDITAGQIFKGDIDLLDRCDIIVANLNNFRGHEMDSGTAFELGYAYAKGLDMYGYISKATSMKDIIGEKDENGFIVEDFDMPVNLMIGVPTKITEGGFEDCVKKIKK